MKINSINIVSFGKLKNLKLDLSSGLNLIFGENESGKTTITEFIKMMFYGTTGRATDISKNARKRYAPWDGSKMGGTIDFEHAGTNYRIEREFKASNSADIIKLINLDSGTTQSLSGKQEIGAEFFGISAATFERSAFINNSVIFANDAASDSEITQKLSNIVSSGEEDASFRKVFLNITDCKETIISKSKKKGKLPELKAKLAEIEQAQAAAINAYRQAELAEAELKETELEAQAAQNAKKEYFNLLKTAELTELKAKLEAFKNAVTLYEETEKSLTLLDGSVADSAFLESCQEKLEEIKRKSLLIEEKLRESNALSEEISALKIAETKKIDSSNLKTKKAQLEEKLITAENECANAVLLKSSLEINKRKSGAKPNWPLIIIGAALAALSAVLGVVLNENLIFILSGACLILVLLGFIFKSKKKEGSLNTANIDAQISQLQNLISELKAEIAEISNTLNDQLVKDLAEKQIISAKNEFAVNKRAELLELQTNAAQEKAEFFQMLCKFRHVSDITGAENALTEIKNLLAKLSEYKIKADYAVSSTGCRSLEDALKKLEALPANLPKTTLSKEELTERFKSASEKCIQLTNLITTRSLEIKQQISGLKSPEEYEKIKAEYLSEIADLEEFYDCTEIALEALEQADTQMRKSFGGRLQNRALELFSGLTANNYTDISVSKDFEISATKSGDISSHNVNLLSKGTLDQAYFALRLTLSELLSNECGGLPVILDDIFSQYDDNRTIAGFEFLKKYSQKNQVIFFTCHKSLAEKSSEINLIKL